MTVRMIPGVIKPIPDSFHGESMDKNSMTLEEYQKAQRRAQHTHAPTAITGWAWRHHGIADPQSEYKFHPMRKWRIDYAWPDIKLAVEIEGGFRGGEVVTCDRCKSVVRRKDSDGVMRVVRLGGAHVGARYESDLEKYNTLAADGWTLLRYLPGNVDFRQVANAYTSLLMGREHAPAPHAGFNRLGGTWQTERK